VRDGQQLRLDPRFHLRQLGIQAADAVRQLAEACLQAVRRGWIALAHQLADALAAGVALVLGGVRPGEQGTPASVELQDALDGLWSLSLAADRPLDRLRVVADHLQPDHRPLPPFVAAGSPAPAATRKRSTTKRRSSEASSQPARGPLPRPSSDR